MHAITLRFLASQFESPVSRRVHGGTVLRWMDEAGFACASAWSGGDCVTSFVGNASFDRTVAPGDLVEVQAQLAFTGRHCMGLAIEVSTSRVTEGAATRQVLQCVAVYTAVDAEGEARPVDTWNPETPGDIALAQHVRAQVDAARGAGAVL